MARHLTVTRREFATSLLLGAGTILPPRLARGHSRHQGGAARVNGERLNARLSDLRQFGGTPQGGTHRLGYSDEDKQARVLVGEWMLDAGLTPETDLAGNLIGRSAGSRADVPPLVFGSHIDSVPDGGNYDGNVGVVAAIEVARTLQERGARLRHPLEVAVWANEEGGLFGSRAVSGQFTAAELSHTTTSGKTVGEGIAFLGGDSARLGEVVRRRGEIAAYLELHIEQGGNLEAERTAIGIVEGIVGIRQWDVTVTGVANHAGTTPMDKRQDALLAAARFIELVNRAVTSTPGRQVGTVGRLQARPGAT
ncbi:MAG: Zn-dependent hydrolase, partial [Acidobacteria bacterium]|nr:Zn-dependent hydrolase [Acidobacteriota bacterium]